MKLGNAMAVLGLMGATLAELTDKDVKSAFRVQMKIYHPDTMAQYMINLQESKANGGNLDHARISWSADELKEARDTLLNRRNVDEFACRTCKGTGSVRYRMGTRPCGACKGTGDGNGS